MDTISPEERSDLMRRICSSSTAAEVLVCKIARRIKRNFQVNSRRLPGSPDLAFFKLRRAVFVHGCFWHQHSGCRRSNFPKSRLNYWEPKLQGNVERDREVRRRLKALGWNCLTIWECECQKPERIQRKLEKFLSKQ